MENYVEVSDSGIFLFLLQAGLEGVAFVRSVQQIGRLNT